MKERIPDLNKIPPRRIVWGMKTKTGRRHSACLRPARVVAALAAATILTTSVRAQDPSTSTTLNTSGDDRSISRWDTSRDHWEKLLQQKTPRDEVSLGRGDWKLTGPVVSGLRRTRTTGNRSFMDRLRGIPIVRLFVPLPMPNPPGGGRYFLWGESDKPWTAVACGAVAGDNSNPTTHESKAYLISVQR